MKHTKILPLFLLIPCWPVLLCAQPSFLQGYMQDISGTRFTYHSPLPDVESSLLSRANANFDPIVWQTEAIPADLAGEFVAFIWLYGMDVLNESQQFELSVNDRKWFSFSNPRNNDETLTVIEGEHGASLTFRRTMIDKHGDQMGFATMKLPVSAISKGKPALIKVDGADQKSNAWYMTFKAQLKSDIKISQNQVVARKGSQLFHVARFDIIHLGDPVTATIRIDAITIDHFVNPGHNAIDVELPQVTEPTVFNAEVRIGSTLLPSLPFTLTPVKEWTIYLVQHTHTDIGYTRSQTEILAEHLRYIDNALDYCDQTDQYPEDARFRWTCEASWAVREYLRSRPQVQIDRLLRRIKEGRIEVTGMFFNFCDIVDETALAFQTKTLKEFKDRGIDVKTAMQNDVNGIGWCMIDFYQNTGVRYLTMGQHGHRAHVPFDKPTAFWWESPAGNQLLAYRSEHYMHGNALALTSGYLDAFRVNLSAYLSKLERKGYPFDRTAFQFSGYVTDNSPPSTGACEIVKEWNEKYAWPRLRMALANEFMIYLDTNWSEELSVKQVAWPDWWTDGFGSSMIETKAARTAHSEIAVNTGLASLSRLLGADLPSDINTQISTVFEKLLFYDEHTFGAAESISDPMSENSVVQWGEKSAYAWEAMKLSGLLKEKMLGLLQPFIPQNDNAQLTVFNTLNWQRSGLVRIFIEHAVLPPGRQFRIVDDQGKSMTAHPGSSRPEGSYWDIWVKDIPPLGYKTFQIEVDDLASQMSTTVSAGTILENQFYRLEIDAHRGAINSIYDKTLQLELLDQVDTINLGRIIYERLANREAMERLTNTNRDTVYAPLKKKMRFLQDIHVSDPAENSVWKSITIHGQLPECADDRGVMIEIRLFHSEKRIDLLYGMHKLPVESPEAVYVAFPFSLPGGKLTFDVQGGIVSPGVNQLEGTASDWNTIQNFAAVSNQEAQIVFSSNDIPLVQFGAINTGRYYYKHIPATTHIYSWVLNNYWTTNFKKSQGGEMKWTYSITSSDSPNHSSATRFGFETRIPLIGRIIPPFSRNGSNTQAASMTSQTFWKDQQKNLLLVNVQPSIDGNGVVLHLRETEGDHSILNVSELLTLMNAESAYEVNVLEEPLQELKGSLSIDHYESKFIKLALTD